MPTPSGKLKAGDRLIHDRDPDTVWVVAKREGNDLMYSIHLRREDGKKIPHSMRNVLGDAYAWRLLEAHYWVFKVKGGWELLKEEAPKRPRHGDLLDIQAPKDMQIIIQANGKAVWVCVGGVTVMRAHGIANLEIIDHRGWD
jgi:hypothetical protein